MDVANKILQVMEMEKPQTAKNTLRLGVTGAPGVGKSTFIEALGHYLAGEGGEKVAVLVQKKTA